MRNRQRRQPPTLKWLSAAEIRTEARRRAGVLKDMPHSKLVARFEELTEAIRSKAIAKGTAIEGDWQRD
jgi:hypothetical protein